MVQKCAQYHGQGVLPGWNWFFQ